MISFTKKAMQRWNKIDDKIRLNLLENVYCSKCKGAVKIINFEANLVDNDLILKGKCSICNNNIARLIEE